MTDHAAQLRTLLARDTVLKTPGIYDGLSARLVEQAGFEAAFLSGACLSFSRFGRPDMGLVSASELVDAVAAIRERTHLPLIVDIDTGFGNALNVQRTVRTVESAGASAMQLEDQLAPKRCGHMTGKQVVSCAEMVGKIKAALDARRNDETLLIARTDALGVAGFEEAMERAERYLEAGADALFIEAPASVEQMAIIAERFAKRAPLVHNLVEGGNSPVAGTDELSTLGYRIALFPAALLHAFLPRAQQLLAHILDQGQTANFTGDLAQLDDINSLLGATTLLEEAANYAE